VATWQLNQYGETRRVGAMAGLRKRGGSLIPSADDSLTQPLLSGKDEPEEAEIPDDSKGIVNNSKELRVWKESFLDVLAQWLAWFAGNMVKGASQMLSQIGGSINIFILQKQRQIELPPPELSSKQTDHLTILQKRLRVPFDGSLEEHQDALRALWDAAYPDRKLNGFISSQWKDMGWQGNDPSTDFRGGGYISLENLLFLAANYPALFRRLLHKENGKRSEWEYPFAVAGLNVTFMLISLLDLRSEVPNSFAGRRFLQYLEEDEKAFDRLFCVAFEMLDEQWLEMHASYMEFNEVMKQTRLSLEKQMADNNVQRVQDLPSFKNVVQQ